MCYTNLVFTYKNKAALIKERIAPDSYVLDVGFWGQGVTADSPHWPHRNLRARTVNLYGVDLDYDEPTLISFGLDPTHYLKANAESFQFPVKFDVIFAGDIIEHFSNPGLFLNSCLANLKGDGVLILTTPNCFNLFVLAEKFRKEEPYVNPDHTFYFNRKVLQVLLAKNGMAIKEWGYVYQLDVKYQANWKKKVVDVVYRVLSWFTKKYLETLVVIAGRA